MNSKNVYPANIKIDYPERLDKLTTFFRIFTIIPIFIILALLIGDNQNSDSLVKGWRFTYNSGGIVFIPTVLMILFRKKYPKWWFDWNLALIKFVYRVFSYLFLLRDEYPSTDEEQAIHIELAYPDVEKELNRGLPLIKWLLALPHIVILLALYLAVFFGVIIAWFAILFTGVYPRGIFDFVTGVMRWSLRVSAYAVLLVTDQYPPFSLSV